MMSPKMNWLPPSFQDLLLEEGSIYEGINGIKQSATGTGIITLLGSARSGKTSLAYAMIDTVIRETKRPISFIGFPDVVMKSMPDHWQNRIYNPQDIEKIIEFNYPSVILLDDTAVTLNSRDAMTKSSKLMSRLAGVISHIGGGLTVILTTQSMSGVDLSLLRYTQLAVGVRKVSPMTLWSERSHWLPRIREAQYEINAHSKEANCRDVYYSLMDDTLCRSWFPSWLSREENLDRADKLSRPFRYMEKKKLMEILTKPPESQKKRRKKEDAEE